MTRLRRRDVLVGASLWVACRDQDPAPEPVVATASPIEIWLGGDVHLGASMPRWSPRLAERLRGAEGIVNLEGPIGAAPFTRIEGDTVALASSEESVAELRRQGVRAVSLANNHMRDRGADGVTTTVAAARRHDLLSAEESTPLFWEQHGQRIGVCAFDLSGSETLPASLASRVEAAAAACDALVVAFHVTGAPSYIPQPRLRRAVDAAVVAGAQVVVAHGTHALGPVERRRSAAGDVVVAWGLGNLLFSCRCTTELEGAILRVRIAGKRIDATVIPLDAGLMGNPAAVAADARLALELFEAIGSSRLEPHGDVASF